MASIRNLPFRELVAINGNNTHFSPDAIVARDGGAQFTTTCKNADGFEEFQSVAKIPGSTRVSNSHSAAVVSLHYFEYTDLSGTRQREVLSLGNGQLSSIESDKSLTSLKTGLESEPLCEVTMLDRIHLSSPEQRDLATGGIKYDGEVAHNWGVQAPGDEQTVIFSFDDNTDWTEGETTTTLSDSSVSIDGGGSTQLDIASAQTGSMSQGSLSLDLSAAGQDELFLWFFVPSAAFAKLSTDSSPVALSVELASSTSNYDTHDFLRGDLAGAGWNLLVLDLDSPTSTGGSGATLSSIDTVTFTVGLDSSTTQAGFLFDLCYITDEGAPTVAVGASGNPDGTYTYRVTYFTYYGHESNAGPPSASLTLDSEKGTLTNVPTSGDPQVIARRIYRDIGGDGIYRFVDQIDDNTTTSFTDDLADASLGSTQPPIAGDSDFDNSPPGRLLDVVAHESRALAIDADSRFTLKFSEPNQPEAFRLIDQIQLEDELVGLRNHALGTLAYSTDAIYLVTGDGISTPIVIEKATTQSGANGFRAICPVKGLNITVRETEVFLVGNPTDPWFLNGPVLDQFQALTATDLDELVVVHNRARYQIAFLPKAADTFIVYEYATKGFQQITGDGAGTDPQDLRVGAWRSVTLPSTVDPRSAAIVERTADVPELWIGGADGYVYKMYDTSVTTFAENTGTADIDCQIEYAAVPIGANAGGRGEPRYLEVNGYAASSTVWTATFTLLSAADGDEIGSQTATFTLDGNSSPLIPVPKIGDRGEWLKVKLSQATSSGVGRIRSAKIYYIPRVDFRGPRAA